MATAPTPPVGLALPEAYTAMSAATTRAKRPGGRSQMKQYANEVERREELLKKREGVRH